jgi:anti-sigma regulatory factor (Ser/Thr protein kinase)
MRQVALPIDEVSQVADARRQATEIARSLGLNETDRGRVAIVVTEAATNILKHAGSGMLLIRPLPHPVAEDAGEGIEVIALDNGPGLPDAALSFADGHSTAGTAGTGLGALARLSDQFDWYSDSACGSTFWMALWPGRAAPDQLLQIGAVCLPLPGETLSGDDWRVEQAGGRCAIMVADGLGHGLEAYRASMAATDVLPKRENWPAADLIHEAHGALRATRGAAVSILSLNLSTGQAQFAGVGNVAAFIGGHGARKQLVTHNGIVGHNMRKVGALDVEWPHDSWLLMHSDGLSTQWNLNDFPGLDARHPAVIAATVCKAHWRKRDDVTVLVARRN